MERLSFNLPRVEAPEMTSESGMRGRSIGSSTFLRGELHPMDLETASKLVRRLLAGYPHLGAHDPEGYWTAMIQTMSEYPSWAGERSILRVDEERSEFPPTEKKLRSWLNDAVSAFRYAEQWNARVAKQLADRRSNEPEPANPKGDGAPGTVYSNYDEAVKKHGRPHGPFEPGRMLPYEA